MGVRCTRVERWIYGYYSVRYSDERDPVKKPLLGMRHCDKPSVITVEHKGLTFHWCAEHAKEPTCGVTIKEKA